MSSLNATEGGWSGLSTSREGAGRWPLVACIITTNSPSQFIITALALGRAWRRAKSERVTLGFPLPTETAKPEWHWRWQWWWVSQHALVSPALTLQASQTQTQQTYKLVMNYYLSTNKYGVQYIDHNLVDKGDGGIRFVTSRSGFSITFKNPLRDVKRP